MAANQRDSLLKRHKSLTKNLILFGRLLRSAGIGVTPANLMDTVKGLRFIAISQREDFRELLRTTLISDRDQIERFNQLFDLFWTYEEITIGTDRSTMDDNEKWFTDQQEKDEEGLVEELLQETIEGDELDKGWEQTGASLQEITIKKDFILLDQNELERVQRLILRLAKKIGTTVSRQYKAQTKVSTFDFRRTFRKSLRFGGELIDLKYREPKITKSKIFLICDVSGSMSLYSRFFILFMYGLQSCLTNSETFVFSTRLTRITPLLRHSSFDDAMAILSEEALNWSGGTNIGESLENFCLGFMDSIGNKKTIVIIISDGWDRGEPDVLIRAMGHIKRRSKRIFWLNPLLSCPDYEPLCMGMKTALPFVDHFLPLYNLESLEQLGRILEHSMVYSYYSKPIDTGVHPR